MSVAVTIEDPAAPEIVDLLETHLTLMRSTTPPESVHALDIEALRAADIAFWTVRDDGAVIGCGAMKALGGGHGEIKSMHVRAAHRGLGIADLLVKAVLAEAGRRGYTRLSLETGSTDHFAAARRLYARYGFAECGPFGDYTHDPHSTFMTKALEAV